MDQDKSLRAHLVALLNGGQAYETFEDAIKEFKPEDRGVIPAGAEHSAWQIVDHMVRALVDIIEFSENESGEYKERDWPADYWADEPLGDWAATIKEFHAARTRMEKLISDPKNDLHRVFPWGDGQTLLREAMLAADHHGYHIGQLVELKRWLDASKK
jgi:hypothetical protein